MARDRRIAWKALLYSAVLFIPTSPLWADPTMMAFPLITMGPDGTQGCQFCIPFSALSFSVQTSLGFASASTSGGGVANVTAPQINFSNGPGVSFGSVFSSITTIGPGTASAQFGGTAEFDITNTGTTGGYIAYDVLLGPNFGIHANPSLGETLAYNSYVHVSGPGIDDKNGASGICDISSQSYECTNFFDHSIDLVLAYIDAGQTARYTLTESATWSLAEVPEPSSLVLLLGTLGGLLSVDRLRRRVRLQSKN